MKMFKILTFVVIALFATTAWSADPCADRCPDTVAGYINYCAPGAEPGSCSCTLFDYESGSGYCTGTFKHPGGITMKLCDCADVQNIDPNKDYSLQVKILTEGVYWAPMNPSVAATPVDVAYVNVTSYATGENLCKGIDGISHVTSVCRYLDAGGTLLIGTNDTCTTGGLTDYALSISACQLTGERATTFCTEPAQIFESLRSFVTIDIPAMYYDNTKVNLGTEVKIAVYIKSSKGVCLNCQTNCECASISIGVFGCHTNKCELFYSYVIVDDPGWWSGITVTNKTDYTGTAIFTFYDQFGNKAKAVIPVKGREIIVDMIDNILAKATGDMLNTSESIQFYVSTDFDSEGMCILGDAITGGVHGYNATNTCCSCATH